MTPPGSPVIAAFDDDESARAVLEDALAGRYESSYTVVVDEAGDTAHALLRGWADAGADVALLLADIGSGGAQLLADAHTLHPHAKRGLLLRWGENRAAREAIVDVLDRDQADYFVIKPTTTPDETFHRAITEFLDEWWRRHGSPFEAVRVVAADRSARSSEICDLLQRHDLPYGFYDSASAAGRALLDAANIATCDRPVVILGDGRAFVDPTNVEVAEAIGARVRPVGGVHDVVVIGGGPAGLAVAVGAASEGLRTVLVEPVALGGQAGTSSLIRNYLGFPRGISGAELAACAFDQAIFFGTEMIYGSGATALGAADDLHVVELSSGASLQSRTVVIATGVSYRRLALPELDQFNGLGVYYGAATSEARSLAGEPVYVVGGGNSAGQAAMHLAHSGARVTIAVRSDALAKSMSDYLIKDIEAEPNIEVRYGVEVLGGAGATRLEALTLADCRTGNTEVVPAAALFVLIGAEPFTDWLPPPIERDDSGYIRTGSDDREFSLETTMPGVFAVGDVRRGSVKRVASAVGEGSVCVRLIHDYLASSR